jgi:hypothetical protein
MKILQQNYQGKSLLTPLRMFQYETILNKLRNIEKLCILHSVVDAKNSFKPKIMLEVLLYEGMRYSGSTIYPYDNNIKISMIYSDLEYLFKERDEAIPTIYLFDEYAYDNF